jgi:hypothetical protein
MVRPNVWEAFHAHGLDYDTRSEPYRGIFDEEKLRGSASFRELSPVDFPLYQLCGRRCIARFGWINRSE